MEKGVVEKCLQKISDPFTLVVLASYRSQELASGMNACIPTEGSKDALVALKEISSGNLDISALEDRMVHSLQKFAFLSEEGLNDSIDNPIAINNRERLEKPSFHAEALFNTLHSEKPAVPILSVVENHHSEDDDNEDLDSDDQEFLWESDDEAESDDIDGHSDGDMDSQSPQDDLSQADEEL